MSNQPRLFDGVKSIPLNQLPEAAWTVLQGEYNDSDKLEKYRKAVGVLKRCIIIRQNSVRRVPWCILDASGKTLYESTEPRLPQNLRWLRSMRHLIGLTEAALILKSEAFWYKKMSLANTVMDLRWFSPVATKAKWTGEGLTSFERIVKSGAQPETYSTDDIVYIWLADAMQETKPDASLAAAAMSSAGVLFNVDQFAINFMERGAIKATLLTAPKNIAPQEKARLKTWWDRFYRGVKNAGAAEVVADDVKPVVIGEGLKELSDTDLTGERREDIATTLGIPHSMVFSNASNFATAQQDEVNFYNMTVIPECDIIGEAANEQLFDALGLQFQFQPEKMDIYQDDEANRASAFKDYVTGGMRVSVAAQILGVELPNQMEYADLDTGSTPADPTGSTAPDPAQTNQAEPITPDQVKALRKADLEKWQRKALKRIESGKSADCEFESDWLSQLEIQLIRSRLDVSYSKSVVNTIFEQAVGGGLPENFFMPTCWTGKAIPDFQVSVIAWLKALTLYADPNDPESDLAARMEIEKRLQADLEKAFIAQQNQLLARSPTDTQTVVNRVTETSGSATDALRRALIASTDLGVAISVKQFENIGLGFDWTLAHADARDWADRYVGELITRIDDTTRRHVQQAVSQWISNGDPLRVLVSQLAPTFGRNRAELIASTEVTNAYAEGTIRGYRVAGYAETEPKQKPAAHPRCRCRIALKINNDGSANYVWLTANDELVCPICGGLNGSDQGVARSNGPRLPRVLTQPQAELAYDLSEGARVREALTKELEEISRKEVNFDAQIVALTAQIEDIIAAYETGGFFTETEMLARYKAMREAKDPLQKQREEVYKQLQALRREAYGVALKHLALPENRQGALSVIEDKDSFKRRKGVKALRDKVKVANDFVNRVAPDGHLVTMYFMAGRAAASNGDIHINAGSNVPTIIHEIGHTIEYTRGAAYRAKRLAYFNSRTEGDKVEKLKDIYPNSGYGQKEVAKKDKWQSAYTGKIYDFDSDTNSSSELISMGIEQLYESPSKFVREDPEFFDFIVSYLRGSL